MDKATGGREIGSIERVLLGLCDETIGALYRVAIGFATLPGLSFLLGNDVSGWTVVAFLLLILILLRIVPATIRRLVPFSRTSREAWAVGRRLAKRYDSYQWRKLVWIGVGLTLYTAASGQFSPPRILICTTCLLVGIAGTVRWRAVLTNGKHAVNKSF